MIVVMPSSVVCDMVAGEGVISGTIVLDPLLCCTLQCCNTSASTTIAITYLGQGRLDLHC